MKTLILSGNTGEGHNSCAAALSEYFISQNCRCDTENVLSFIPGKIPDIISAWHVYIYRHFPWLFRFGYSYSENHPALFRENSYIYKLLTSGSEHLYSFIKNGNYEHIICTHVFSALILTDMLKKHPIPEIKTGFVATDYTFSPGGDSSSLDFYFIPDIALADEFIKKGVPADKIRESGIPVRKTFYNQSEKALAKEVFGINPNNKHLLVMCGSMGCGSMHKIAKSLSAALPDGCDATIACGTNIRLYKKLNKKYSNRKNIHICKYVDDISLLMDSADLYLTKPGGISVTEATAKSLPMVFIDAVAGCEEYNKHYFISSGGAYTADTPSSLAVLCSQLLCDDEKRTRMSDSLSDTAKKNSAELIFNCFNSVQK